MPKKRKDTKRARTHNQGQHQQMLKMLADAHKRMDERGYPKAKKK